VKPFDPLDGDTVGGLEPDAGRRVPAVLRFCELGPKNVKRF